MAIGLQAVDGLKVSGYLLELARRNIEGEISMEEVDKLLDEYYEEKHKGYLVTKMLYLVEAKEAFFVVREKHKMLFEVVLDKNYNNPGTGVMADQIIKFKGHKTKKQYPKELRRIVSYDKEGNRTFVFYTNNFNITAEQVALLYKYRWRVELFFKWLKQHLRVKEFYGTTENAVKIQIYAAITAYCLVVIVQEELKLEMDTYDVLRILNTSLLTKMPLIDLLDSRVSLEVDNMKRVAH